MSAYILNETLVYIYRAATLLSAEKKEGRGNPKLYIYAAGQPPREKKSRERRKSASVYLKSRFYSSAHKGATSRARALAYRVNAAYRSREALLAQSSLDIYKTRARHEAGIIVLVHLLFARARFIASKHRV